MSAFLYNTDVVYKDYGDFIFPSALLYYTALYPFSPIFRIISFN